ncbi:MAG: universal stress protein [Syntrophomonadaceae bacterium]|nr:universal stress protein [Syntrophomonadaceae bacterium]
MFNKALVPINASDLSERVINATCRCLNSGMVREAVLLSVWDAGKIDYTKLHAGDREMVLKANAQGVLDKYQQQIRQECGCEVSVLRAGGNPADIILDLTEKGGYDLIIMGSRRLNKVQELIYGSVSDRVTRISGVPVLIIK